MLQPRETDIPALFLVFIVLPLVTYILLGKWSETSKKKERISILAQQAAEEATRVETMATANVFPLLPLPNNANHHCAKCYGPAGTRCSRCKSIWYCSGRCQIIHWREVHKHECQQLDNSCGNSSPKPSIMGEVYEKVLFDGNQPMTENTPPENIDHPFAGSLPPGAADCITDSSGVPLAERSSLDRRPSRKITLRRGDVLLSGCSGQSSESGVTSSRMSCDALFKEAAVRHKLRESHTLPSSCDINDSAWMNSEHGNSRCTMPENHNFQRQIKHAFDSRNSCGISNSSNAGSGGMKPSKTQIDGEKVRRKETTCHDESAQIYASNERGFMKRNNKAKSTLHSQGTKVQKSPKTTVNLSREQSCPGLDFKGVDVNDSKITRTKDVVPSQGRDSVSGMGIMKMIGLMKPSKLDRQEDKLSNANRDKKRKMLFPYEEFVKFFQCDGFSMSPRGLVNCGNSCYANAVLQCLSCTKPLINFLLRRSHSRACCVRDWCLMCELEQHVMMLRESGGPLSPSRILSHIRSINCQIGDGSQEDAHEFLRFLVASMQSICLESLGGENVVDPRLQETTFIQHTFGGRLRSKVKCLRCHHESQRSENIMDLTLEIFGWVESLEDALTQFTSPEDLDGENMYRCGRCATYVQARKQLSIQEAPNILTIVLKRFQEGSYGKINKCISFPDMLDMVPFMTGTDDVPPLYMLYGVVVHLDTLNASFSGHYISYVKDMQGNWFRIDDTEVQPVEMSQVMSEGAYILFYIRSSPRSARACTWKTSSQQAYRIPKQWPSRSQRHSRPEESRLNHHIIERESLSDPRWDMSFANYSAGGSLRNTNRSRQAPATETGAQPMNHEYSDAASSDWSLFTSSDEASFTTESTRDSFSTVDYADASNMDPFSSILNSLYASEYHPQKTIACNVFSTSKSQTRFFSENMGSVWECYVPEVSFSTAEAFGNAAALRQGQGVTYGSGTRRGPPQKSVNCNI